MYPKSAGASDLFRHVCVPTWAPPLPHKSHDQNASDVSAFYSLRLFGI